MWVTLLRVAARIKLVKVREASDPGPSTYFRPLLCHFSLISCFAHFEGFPAPRLFWAQMPRGLKMFTWLDLLPGRGPLLMTLLGLETN